ncbi:hypothetical protein AB5J72_39535 [Streptomyces sp. CG1]|uniref:hypothetical protein n=1 Tax=Streptomyces sp. CG1 TaxID=1287523 RepID=UPI0034E1AF35
MFQASARPSQRPFDLVSRAFGGTLHQGTDTVASAPYAPVSERTDLSLLPREIVAQFSVVSEVLASLARRAAGTFVLVVLEDLQWAGQADITFATRLLTYTRTSPIWFIATHRRGRPSVRLAHFLEAASARQSECERAADLCPGAS